MRGTRLVLTLGCKNFSSFFQLTPLTCLVNFFKTLHGKENDYLMLGNERKLPIWCDNDLTYF